MADRWLPTHDFMLAKVDGKVLVLRLGGLHVKQSIADDETMLRPIAEAVDYDEGLRILKALRAALTASREARDA